LGEALGAEPHVLMRHFAKAAATALNANGYLQLDATTADSLQRINVSPFPFVASAHYGPYRARAPARDWASRRFHFAFDMDRYWAEPLGNVFGVATSDIEDLAEEIVCDDWGMRSYHGWKQDARRAAGVLRDDYTSHGSLPRIDSLDFYLSFHALMTAAGKLLVTTSVHANPDGGRRFEEWIARHLLTRKDGRWLADRRDPVPPDVGKPWRGAEQSEWRWSVNAEELARSFDPGGPEFVVWGHWTSGEDPTDQSTSVTSALVSRENSLALLRALQTIDNPRDFRLPRVGDDDAELREAGFELTGWIEADHCSSALDEHDPWAGRISYPPRRLAQFVRQAKRLAPDSEERVWTDGQGAVVRAEIWGSGRDRDGYADDEGDRVLVDKRWLTQLLSQLDRDLIVEAQIEHRLRRDYSRRSLEEIEFPHPYSKLFLVRSDGSVVSI
jgi:hypothetical protein